MNLSIAERITCCGNVVVVGFFKLFFLFQREPRAHAHHIHPGNKDIPLFSNSSWNSIFNVNQILTFNP